MISSREISSLGVKPEIVASWNEFAAACEQDAIKSEVLASAIFTATEYGIESDLINEIFAGLPHVSNEDDLTALSQTVSNFAEDLKKHHYDANQRVIDGWSARVEEWKEFKNFDAMYVDYLKDVSNLISSIEINAWTSNAVKKAVLRQVNSLAEVMNQAIISLKNSSDYDYRNWSAKHVKRFAKLIDPLNDLMTKWVNAIPDAKFAEWNKKVDDSKYLTKSSMLKEYASVYKRLHDKALAMNASDRHLKASGKFSPASAAVGSASSFARQFADRENDLSLEDLHQLMLANIAGSIFAAEERHGIRDTRAPVAMRPVLDAITATQLTQLFGVTHQSPRTTFDFTAPISHASAKLILEFNAKTQSFSLQWKFFGKDSGQRMTSMEKLVKYDGILRGATLPFEPVYDSKKGELVAVWNFGVDAVEAMSASMNELISRYKEIIKNKGLGSTCSSSLFDKSMQKFFALDKGVQERCISAMNISQLKLLGEKMHKHASANEIAKYIKKCPSLLFAVLADNSKLSSSTIETFLSGNPSFADFEKIVAKLGLDYKVTRSWGSTHTLAQEMVVMFNSADVLAYLAKTQPNLSKQTNLLHHYFKKQMKIDGNLVAMMVDLGATASLSGLSDIPQQNRAAYMALVDNQLAAMSNKDFGNWMAAELKNGTLSSKVLADLVTRFESKLDMTDSLVAKALVKYCDGAVVLALLAKQRPDLSKCQFNLYTALLENKSPNAALFGVLMSLNASCAASDKPQLIQSLTKLYLKSNNEEFLAILDGMLPGNVQAYSQVILDRFKNGCDSAASLLGLVQKTVQYLDLSAKVHKTPLIIHLYNKVVETGHSSEYMNTVLGTSTVDLATMPGVMAGAIASSQYGFTMYLLLHGTNFDACSDIRFKELTYNRESRELLVRLLERLSPQKLTQVMSENANSSCSKTFFSDMFKKFESVLDLSDPVLAAYAQKHGKAAVSAMSFVGGDVKAAAQPVVQPVATVEFPSQKM